LTVNRCIKKKKK